MMNVEPMKGRNPDVHLCGWDRDEIRRPKNRGRGWRRRLLGGESRKPVGKEENATKEKKSRDVCWTENLSVVRGHASCKRP